MLRSSISLALFAALPAAAWRNGAALTPPMGFANWNLFGCDYDDAFFREIADAFVSTGLRDKGYAYMLVQECIVPKGSRDPVTHVVIPNATKFPHGLADLADYFHSKGLLAGIYTDVAWLTCADYEGSGPGGDHPAAPGYWPLDALTYAQWGFDMIEADFCNTGGRECFKRPTQAQSSTRALAHSSPESAAPCAPPQPAQQ
jgi:alpha-galactosidase